LLLEALAGKPKADGAGPPDDAEKKEAREKAKKLMALVGFTAGKSALKAVAGPVAKLLDSQRKARGAWCGLNAASAVEYFSRAGIVIANSIHECAGKQPRFDGPETMFDALMSPCMADIAEAVSALIWAGSWIAAAASECAAHANYESLCATSIMALIAAISDTTSAGDVMRQTCNIPPVVPSFVAPFPVRRLQGMEGNPAFTPELADFDAKKEMSPEALDLEMAMCVQDAVQAATIMGQFGVVYDNTIVTCTLKDFGTVTENACVTTASLMVDRMLTALSYIAAAVSHCGTAIGARMGGICVGAVARVCANFAGLPADAAAMNLACPGTQASLVDSFGVLTNPMLKLSSLGRRLAELNATAPGFLV